MFKYKIINLEPEISQKINSDKYKNLIIKIIGPCAYETFSIKKNCLISIQNRNLYITSMLNNSFFGTYSKVFLNTQKGLICNYKVLLEVRGIGYKINKIGRSIQLAVGLSSPIIFKNIDNPKIYIKKNKVLKVIGSNLCLVQQTASRLRLFKKPEPYKGKGIRYLNELVKHKEGKKKKK